MTEEQAPHRLQLLGKVRPPRDLMKRAREDLSEMGFLRLMQVTQGAEPTPLQLVREVEYEREGKYPEEQPTQAALKKIQEDAFILAAAMTQLSPSAFAALMARIGQRPPTAQELCEAVDAERTRNQLEDA